MGGGLRNGIPFFHPAVKVAPLLFGRVPERPRLLIERCGFLHPAGLIPFRFLPQVGKHFLQYLSRLGRGRRVVSEEGRRLPFLAAGIRRFAGKDAAKPSVREERVVCADEGSVCRLSARRASSVRILASASSGNQWSSMACQNGSRSGWYGGSSSNINP